MTLIIGDANHSQKYIHKQYIIKNKTTKLQKIKHQKIYTYYNQKMHIKIKTSHQKINNLRLLPKNKKKTKKKKRQ